MEGCDGYKYVRDKYCSSMDNQHRFPKSFSFKLHPVHKFTNQRTSFQKPVEVGHFSLDGNPKNRSYHDDAHQLRHYAPPVSNHIRFDLREGYDTYISKDDDVKERLTYMLMWISKHREIFSLERKKGGDSDSRLQSDFVIWRGNLTKLLTSPYETREPWKTAITLFNGTIFMSEKETEKAKVERTNRSPRHQEMCYWGHKFEDYLTTASARSHNHQHCSAVNDNEEYRSVLHTQLDDHLILLGAEVDCCIPLHPGKAPDNYVELKTTRQVFSHKQRENFMRFKLLKYWAQSFLSGVPKIVVGLRDDEGIVTSLKEYSTLSIPHLSESNVIVKWDPNVCITFLSRLLTWLKEIVLIDNADVVYMATFSEPFEYVNIEVIDDGSERFLPSWFTDELWLK